LLAIDGLLCLSFVLWLGLLFAQRRPPRIANSAWWIALCLTLLGAMFALNPKSAHDPETWRFLSREAGVAWLPGTFDAAASLPVLRHTGALLLGFLVLADGFAASSRLRWWLLRHLALAGFVIAAVGIAQKAAGSESMLWVGPERSGNVFFAAFRYHANAAAFLNLSWAAAFAVWLRSRERSPTGLGTSLDFCVFFFSVAAVFVNTSKAGQVLGIFALSALCWSFRRQLAPRTLSRGGSILLALVFLAVVSVLLLPAFSASFGNWSALIVQGQSLEGRLLTYGACLRAVQDSWIFGTGPGTFRLVFPLYTMPLGDRLAGIHLHAHQDLLQTWLEWGMAGLLAWVAAFAGALVRLIRHCRHAVRTGQFEVSSSVALVALSTVLVHALVDFPLQIAAVQLPVMVYLALGWRKRRHA